MQWAPGDQQVIPDETLLTAGAAEPHGRVPLLSDPLQRLTAQQVLHRAARRATGPVAGDEWPDPAAVHAMGPGRTTSGTPSPAPVGQGAGDHVERTVQLSVGRPTEAEHEAGDGGGAAVVGQQPDADRKSVV